MIASRLYGHDACERAFRRACAQNMRHHAWLLHGAKGIGKTTLAYKMAAFVLKGQDGHAEQETLPDIDVTDPIIQRMQAQSHQHFHYVSATSKQDAKTASISIEDIRAIHHFLTLTSSQGQTKVVMLDSFDDVIPIAAHALLKILEEPPPHALFIMTAHQLRFVPLTVRSRCRQQRLHPLNWQDFSAFLTEKGVTDTQHIQTAFVLSAGVPTRALQWLDLQENDFYQQLHNLLQRSSEQGRFPHHALLQLAEKIDKDKRQEGTQHLWQLFWDATLHWLKEQIKTHSTHTNRESLFMLWHYLLRLYRQSGQAYLSPMQTVMTTFFSIRKAFAQLTR